MSPPPPHHQRPSRRCGTWTLWMLVYATCAYSIGTWMTSNPQNHQSQRNTRAVVEDGISATMMMTLASLVSTTPHQEEDAIRPTHTAKKQNWSQYSYHPPEPRRCHSSSNCKETTTNDNQQQNDDNEHNRMNASTLCGTAPHFAHYWKWNGKQRSRLNEDKIIYETFFKQQYYYNAATAMKKSNTSSTLLEDTINFRYLELGAFDGIEESNTRFFDECLQWDGILIEPNPKIFPRLVHNRIHSHRFSYAASCNGTYGDDNDSSSNQTVPFFASAFTNAAQDASVNRAAYAKHADKLRTDVPCGSLTPVLLDLYPNGHVHFWSLDTEGSEHFILQHVDFTRIHFDVIIVENTNTYCQQVCESRDAARSILTSAGYQLYPHNTVPRSDLYVHPQFMQGIKPIQQQQQQQQQ